MRIDVNGHSTFVDDHNRGVDPEKPTILWVPGAGMEPNAFALQSRHFAFQGWNSLGVTRPGHGVGARKSHGPHNQTVEEEADWLVALLDALGLKSASVVGHSLGGIITLDFAARHGDRCDKLVLLACAAAIPVHPSLVESAEKNLDIADDLIVGWGFGSGAHQGGSRSIGAWMTGVGRRMLRDQMDGTLFADLNMCNLYQAGKERASMVKVPTFALLAENDRMTPVKFGSKFSELIDDCELEVMRDTGHMVMIERPDETLKAVKRFLTA